MSGPDPLYATPTWVAAIAFSPDGSRLLSGSGDGAVRVWDAATGDELKSAAGHRRGVTAVAYSPDGALFASASSDRTIRVWDARDGIEVAVLRGHNREVNSIAFRPDGLRIVSASEDGKVKIWDALTGKRLMTLGGDGRAVNAVAWSPDAERIVSGSGVCSMPVRMDDNALTLWDASRGRRLASLKGHHNVTRVVAYSPDGGRIISGSDDWTVRVWDAGAGDECAAFLGHSDGVRAVTYSPDASLIVSGSRDGTLRIWDARTYVESPTFRHAPQGVLVAECVGHTGEVLAVAWSPDGRRIASGSGDGTIRMWTAEGLMSGAGVGNLSATPNSEVFAQFGTSPSVEAWSEIRKQADAARERYLDWLE